MIKVYEGERKRASDNNLLGLFSLFGLPLAPHGHPFDVMFAMDENGILYVSSEEKTIGNKNKITISNDKDMLSLEEIERMIKDSYICKVEDKKFLRKAKTKNDLNDWRHKLAFGPQTRNSCVPRKGSSKDDLMKKPERSDHHQMNTLSQRPYLRLKRTTSAVLSNHFWFYKYFVQLLGCFETNNQIVGGYSLARQSARLSVHVAVRR
ncbi:hypothetical protein Fmac_017150 [Flemingia macrophylla]|uniref:Uncharacterized protein n=1 Tax=Flemingia macrophylla TaxID=520843 RepID=A0ABD1M1B4_9FABA